MTRPAAEPHGVARLPGGKIRIPFSLQQPGVIADGMREIGPDDPRYADYDEWLTALDAAAADAGDMWTVTGDIPDSGEHVTLTWRDGIDGWPPDALHWALAAATEGLVHLDDGPRLLAWLQTQGFTETSQARAAAQWEEGKHPRVPGGEHGGEFTRKPAGKDYLPPPRKIARTPAGWLDLWHHTTPAATRVIWQTGKWESQEQGRVFGSTVPFGAGGYGQAAVRIRVPQSKARLETTLATGEQHYSIPVTDLKKEYLRDLYADSAEEQHWAEWRRRAGHTP